MNGLHHFTTPIDWGVAIGYLLIATLAGYALRGKQAGIRDFFLADRSLPWPLVAGSLIATEISAVTFLGLVGSVLALKGDLTYLQWAIGAILARMLVGLYFVRVFYDTDVYSPYDFIGNRLGSGIKKFATVLFTAGSVLAVSVRILIVALPLKVVTPLPFEWCLVLIGVIGVTWTLMGGIRTVIWTDVILVGFFVAGGITALFWILGTFEHGWETLFTSAHAVELFDGSMVDKWRVFNFSTSPDLQFTFWVAIFAVPFLNMSALGVDHTNAQRLFCCRNVQDARKAVIWSSVGSLVTALMLLVGMALFVFYLKNPPTDPLIMDALKWSGGEVGASNMIVPVWIVTEMPAGLRGLILAALFAVAISCLVSALAALSQTTLFLLRRAPHECSEAHTRSRSLVVFWGIVLTGFTLFLFVVNERTQISIIPLISGLTTYTVGPLLGIFLVALLGGGRGNVKGLILGTAISFGLIAFVRDELGMLFMNDCLAPYLDRLLPYEMLDGSPRTTKTSISSEWMWPITTSLTMAMGWPIWENSSGLLNKFRRK